MTNELLGYLVHFRVFFIGMVLYNYACLCSRWMCWHFLPDTIVQKDSPKTIKYQTLTMSALTSKAKAFLAKGYSLFSDILYFAYCNNHHLLLMIISSTELKTTTADHIAGIVMLYDWLLKLHLLDSWFMYLSSFVRSFYMKISKSMLLADYLEEGYESRSVFDFISCISFFTSEEHY